MKPNARRRLVPSLEGLEARAVLSHVVSAKFNFSDGTGAAAFLSALNGGPGSEFVTLIRKQVPNVNRVILQFATGKRSEIDLKGFAAKTPHLAAGYLGPHLDEFNPTAAGALIRKDGSLELAAIMRGPIDRPEPVTYVWGIDRGGPSLARPGFGPSGVGYDAYVSVSHDAYGTSASITDLRLGTTRAIDPSFVKIEGPTVRVFLTDPARDLPSAGVPLAKYRMAFWTRGGPEGPSGIGGAVPGSGSIPFGSLSAKSRR